MAINNGYITLKELQNHLHSNGMPTTFTDADKVNMEIAIEACSRLVDQWCDTTFYARTETRYFTSQFSDLLYVDDLISITTLKTDNDNDGTYEITWQTSDYWLEPRNARIKTNEADKEPYRQIRINTNGNYYFPVTHYGIEITGLWGYTDGIDDNDEPTQIPPFVKNAMLLMANRVYRRKDAIFGVSGTPQLGVMTVQARVQEDTDIINLLSGINKRGFYA
jgi:hypothetical protein